MKTLIDALAKTVSLLAEIAISGTEAAFEKAKPTARVYLKSLIITTLVWLLSIPFLVILKAVTGWAVFGYLAAFLAIILTAALGLLYTPLGLVIGMLAGKTVNPAEAGERYLKFIASVIFVVLMGSLYLVRVPWERNVEAVPILFIAIAAVAIGSSIWGGWLSGRFYTFVALVIMSLTTLSFFFPKVSETIGQKFWNLDTDIAESIGYHDPDPNVRYSPSGSVRVDLREKITFPLVANTWSKEMYIPAGEYFVYTDGEWFEYKGREMQEYIVVRLDNKHNKTITHFFKNSRLVPPPDTLGTKLWINSEGEYMQFRTDVNCTASILPVHRR